MQGPQPHVHADSSAVALVGTAVVLFQAFLAPLSDARLFVIAEAGLIPTSAIAQIDAASKFKKSIRKASALGNDHTDWHQAAFFSHHCTIRGHHAIRLAD